MIGAGERLEMVCLLDTYVHESCLPWMAWLAHQRDCVKRQVSELRTLPATVRMRHLADKLMAAADHALMRFGRASRREEPGPDDLPPVLRGIRAAFSAAMKTIARGLTRAARSCTCARWSDSPNAAIRCRSGGGWHVRA